MQGEGMIHKNQAPTDYQFLGAYDATAFASNPLYSIDSFGGFIQVTWGNAYVENAMGILGSFALNENFNLHTPWGQYLVGPLPGAISSGHLRVVIANCALAVTADCHWTLSWDSVTCYLQYGGGAETSVLTAAAGSMSGAGYDERLNTTELGTGWTVNPGSYTSSCIARPVDAAVSAADSLSMGGGYEYKGSGGAWVQDAVEFDTSGSGGTCSCSEPLPAISGTDSYNVGLANQISASVTVNAYPISCPACISPSGTAFDTDQTTVFTSVDYVRIKASSSSVTSQTVSDTWACNLNGFGTSGTSSSTTASPPTVCSSQRESSRAYIKYTKISVADGSGSPPPCIDPPDCYACAGPDGCSWTAQANVDWPTLPACVPDIPQGISYDVHPDLGHYRSYVSGGTAWVGRSANCCIQTGGWSDSDTSLPADLTWLRVDHKDFGRRLGLLIAKSDVLTLQISTNDGGSWGMATTLGSGTFGSLHIGADRRWWAYGLNGTNIVGYILDAAGNILTGPFTCVAGVDNTGFDAHSSDVTGGGRRMAILCSVGGVLMIYTSADGMHFA
jgi:hypothetical protein